MGSPVTGVNEGWKVCFLPVIIPLAEVAAAVTREVFPCSRHVAD